MKAHGERDEQDVIDFTLTQVEKADRQAREECAQYLNGIVCNEHGRKCCHTLYLDDYAQAIRATIKKDK